MSTNPFDGCELDTLAVRAGQVRTHEGEQVVLLQRLVLLTLGNASRSSDWVFNFGLCSFM